MAAMIPRLPIPSSSVSKTSSSANEPTTTTRRTGASYRKTHTAAGSDKKKQDSTGTCTSSSSTSKTGASNPPGGMSQTARGPYTLHPKAPELARRNSSSEVRAQKFTVGSAGPSSRSQQQQKQNKWVVIESSEERPEDRFQSQADEWHRRDMALYTQVVGNEAPERKALGVKESIEFRQLVLQCASAVSQCREYTGFGDPFADIVALSDVMTDVLVEEEANTRYATIVRPFREFFLRSLTAENLNRLIDLEEVARQVLLEDCICGFEALEMEAEYWSRTAEFITGPEASERQRLFRFKLEPRLYVAHLEINERQKMVEREAVVFRGISGGASPLSSFNPLAHVSQNSKRKGGKPTGTGSVAAIEEELSLGGGAFLATTDTARSTATTVRSAGGTPYIQAIAPPDPLVPGGRKQSTAGRMVRSSSHDAFAALESSSGFFSASLTDEVSLDVDPLIQVTAPTAAGLPRTEAEGESASPVMAFQAFAYSVENIPVGFSGEGSPPSRPRRPSSFTSSPHVTDLTLANARFRRRSEQLVAFQESIAEVSVTHQCAALLSQYEEQHRLEIQNFSLAVLHLGALTARRMRMLLRDAESTSKEGHARRRVVEEEARVRFRRQAEEREAVDYFLAPQAVLLQELVVSWQDTAEEELLVREQLSFYAEEARARTEINTARQDGVSVWEHFLTKRREDLGFLLDVTQELRVPWIELKVMYC